jgi:hypothetical protein
MNTKQISKTMFEKSHEILDDDFSTYNELELIPTFLDHERKCKAIICNDTLWHFFEALDEKPNKFSCIVLNDTYEFKDRNACISFLKEKYLTM